MRNHLTATLFIVLLSLSPFSLSETNSAVKSSVPIVVMHTNKGPITLELYPKEAPITVANFLSYIKSGHYSGTIFHRVIKRFMIQGGGFNQKMIKKPTQAPIINESHNGLHNDRWTIAMARTNDPHSAAAQFFINTRMNSTLDARGNKFGYTVFGKVIEGMHVVKAIEKSVTVDGPSFQNVPKEQIIIESVKIR